MYFYDMLVFFFPKGGLVSPHVEEKSLSRMCEPPFTVADVTTVLVLETREQSDKY